MFLTTKEQLQQAAENKTRVLYVKNGSRHNWTGYIAHYNADLCRVFVQYDRECNGGVYQGYHESAFIGFDPYIKVHNDIKKNLNTDQIKDPIDSYLVVNASGNVIESFGTEENALNFSAEQVIDSNGRTKVFVYKQVFEVATPNPAVIVKDGEGNIIKSL